MALRTSGHRAGRRRPDRRADPDLDPIVNAVRPYWEAGIGDVALLQIGGETQDQFLKEAAEPLLAELRSAASGHRND